MLEKSSKAKRLEIELVRAQLAVAPGALERPCSAVLEKHDRVTWAVPVGHNGRQGVFSLPFNYL